MRNTTTRTLVALIVLLMPAAARAATHAAPARPMVAESLLHTFAVQPDGLSPYAGLLAGANGNFFGTTYQGGPVTQNGLGYGTVYEVSASGQERVLYAFQGGNDGIATQAGVIADGAGNLYGVTIYGGGSPTCPAGCGMVYQLQPSGSGYTERILYSFQGGQDGELPLGTLLMGSAGVLYGTTGAGGGGPCAWPGGYYSGCGTVFSLTPDGSTYTEKVLYRFQSGSDGEYPVAKLTADKKGNLYGTTEFGGKRAQNCYHDAASVTSCGTIFEVSAQGKERILYHFVGGATDGGNPRAALLLAKDGSFYGVTSYGGGANKFNPGAAFKLTRSGKAYTESLIHVFGSGTDGLHPMDSDGLVADKSGNLYGTTLEGGTAKCSCGTVFEISPSGSGYSETVLHSFAREPEDGGNPFGSITMVKNTVYGTTFDGGSGCRLSSACGTVYKVTL